jgi:hypothetical protein
VALALVAIGVAVFLFNSAGGRTRATASTQASGRRTPTGSRLSYRVSSRAAADSKRDSAVTYSPTQSQAIIPAVENYWEDIRQRHFFAAFGYFARGAIDVTEGEFISSQERLGTKGVSFKGIVTAKTKSSATVGVLSLITRDDEYGCRTWSGSFTMVVENGFWRILHAALSPASC